MTDLRKYLFDHELTVKKFAEVVDCHPSYLSAIKKRTMRPGRKIARQIETATGGEVKANHLLNGIKYKNQQM